LAAGASGRTALVVASRELGWSDVRAAIQTAPEVHRVLEAATCAHAIELAAATPPDVIVCAGVVEGASSATFVRDVRRIAPNALVIVIAGRFEAEELATYARNGAVGYWLWRDLSLDMLRHCLALVCTGAFMVVSRSVGQAFIEGGMVPGSHAPSYLQLSEREHVILTRLSDGMSEDQIAREEHLSRRTVRRVIADLKPKLGAQSLFELGMRAAQRRLVE